MLQERKKSEFIKKLSLVLREIIDDHKIIITILDVNLPSKKGNMIIYLSVFPDVKIFEVIEILKKEIPKIKKIIKKMRILRYIPKKIFFRYDQSLKSMEEIDKIFRVIN
ncbi:MAG: hypothetical protein KatS3mg094_272 [Candidatus Parcubacteria bacterium]|nr:MAG: hypothetical protein KatS3mg094_272 [Candidatus Parcubacteria bacterium]